MRFIKSSRSVILLCVLFFCLAGTAFAWDVETHAEMDRLITLDQCPGCFQLDNYLIQNLNLPKGAGEIFDDKDVSTWIMDGGVAEDYDDGLHYIRSFNHFHDPLQPWGQAGYSGPFANQDPYPIRSSILWAEAVNQSGQPEAQYLGNYSWPDARNYFYNALTATDETTRDTNYANCFRAMGQLMHLVQDAAVPEHTRNDFHALYCIEDYVNNIVMQYPTQFDQTVNSGLPMAISPSLFSTTVDPAATIPIAGLFDSNIYNGRNPDVTTGAVGLSEYSNANFYSDDTITSTQYPYPSLYTSAVPVDDTIPDPSNPTKTVTRTYYFKTGDGDNGYLLAGTGYLSDYLNNPQVFLNYLAESFPKDASFIESLKYTNYTSVVEIINYFLSNCSWFDINKIYDMPIKTLDNYCYANYANRLLPRAVGYSSALLQYFFRGQIDAADAQTVTDSNGEITDITLKVRNNTPNESMSNGNLVVSYNYKDSSGNIIYGDSAPVTLSGSICVPFNNETTDDTYKRDFSIFPSIPADATGVHYMLVYRGGLGQETDAVAAKAFTISQGIKLIEITPQYDCTDDYGAQLNGVTFKIKNDTGKTMYADGSTISLAYEDSDGYLTSLAPITLEADIPPGQSSNTYTFTFPDMSFYNDYNDDTLPLELTYNGKLGDDKNTTLTADGMFGGLTIDSVGFASQPIPDTDLYTISSCTITFRNNTDETLHKGSFQFTSNSVCASYGWGAKSFPDVGPPVSIDYDIAPGAQGTITFPVSGTIGNCDSYDMGITYKGVVGDDEDIMVTPLAGFGFGCID